MQPAELKSTYLVLDGNQSCTPVTVTPTLYASLDSQFEGFKHCLLISDHTFEQSWPTWEMHPAGDEILYLLEGEAEFLLFRDGKVTSVRFHEPGTTLIIPRETWHTARVQARCRVHFITPGEGTLNAELPDGLPPEVKMSLEAK